MSTENVELHRRLYAAFNARDLGALVALCDPDISIRSVFAAVSGQVYSGREGVRRWQSDLEEAWGEQIRVEPVAYFDLGEHTLAFDVLHGRGRQSGAEARLPGAAVTRWRNGKCVYFSAYDDRMQACRDAGASGGEQPLAP